MMKLLTFVTILLGIGTGIPQSPSPSNEKCRFDIKLVEVRNYENKIKLKDCFKPKKVVSVTERECNYKCSLEKHGFFHQKKGYFQERNVRDYLKKYTTATDKYVEAVVKMYVGCVTSSRALLESLKQHGVTLRKCKLFGLFEACVTTKLRNEIHNNMDRFCQNQTKQNQTNRNQTKVSQNQTSQNYVNLRNQVSQNKTSQNLTRLQNQTSQNLTILRNLPNQNQTSQNLTWLQNQSSQNYVSLRSQNQTSKNFTILQNQGQDTYNFTTPIGVNKEIMVQVLKQSSINHIIHFLNSVVHFVIFNLAW